MMRARVIFLVILLIAVGAGVVVLNNQSQSRPEILTYSDPGRPHPTVTLDELRPMLTITVEPEQPRVGDLITVRYRAANLGIPAYTITLTPGGEIRAEYASPYITQPAPFENTLVEVVDSSAASGGTLQLRALAAGTLSLSVSASGEARTRMLDQQGTPQTALYWTNASSSAIIIIGE